MSRDLYLRYLRSIYGSDSQIDTVREIVREASNIGAITPEWILQAIKMGSAKPEQARELIHLFLDIGFDVNTIFTKENALQNLARSLDRPLLIRLIEHGMSIDIQDEETQTPLISHMLNLLRLNERSALYYREHPRGANLFQAHDAAVLSLLDVIPFVLEMGADLSLTNKSGNTPIFSIIQWPYTPRIRPIIEDVIRRSDVNVQDNYGITPLMMLILSEEDGLYLNEIPPEEIIQLLLDAGANPLLRDQDNLTAVDAIDIYLHNNVNGAGQDHRGVYERLARFLRQKEQEYRNQHPNQAQGGRRKTRKGHLRRKGYKRTFRRKGRKGRKQTHTRKGRR